ncbi:RdgB/HAM1 family non-canonical purine NTP pyrophosphatase [bacterium]|nr:RdgB/HAM1 family non-canonical purine NTP pyrophosphatase [bacterium]
MKIVVATGNRHKVSEIQSIMTGVTVVRFEDVFGYPHYAVEDGLTFEENAVKKIVDLPALKDGIYLSDDSGLEVDALDGAPGIYSARFGGEAATNNERCLALLELLGDNPNRTSRFRCVIALRFPDGHVQTASGSVEGDITYSLSGTDGFGYDPIFRPKTYPQTFAEMASSQKNELSHRGRALALASQIIFAWHRETNYNAGRG